MTNRGRGETRGRARRRLPLRVTCALVFCAVTALLAVCPAFALARDKHGGGVRKRIAITSTEGGGAAEGPVRAQIARALGKAKVKAVPQKKGTAPTDDHEWLALGQKLAVDGFVQLTFGAARGKHSVDISVRTSSDGASLGTEIFTASSPARLAAVVGKTFWKRLGSAVKLTAPAQADDVTGMPARDLAHEETTKREPPPEAETPPPPPEPEPSPPEPEPAPPPPKPVVRPRVRRPPPVQQVATESSARHEPAFTAAAQLRYLHRSFTYQASPALPGATLNSPAVGLDVAWFPLPNLGVSAGGDFEKWFKLVKLFPTTMLDVHGELVFRLPLSFGELFAQAGVFRHSFTVTDDGSGQRAEVSLPDTTYFGVRAGAALDVRLVEALSLLVDANYRLVTSLGAGDFGVKSAAYFPNAKAGIAFDAGLMLAYHINRTFDVRLGGDVRRYAITTNAPPDAAFAATKAADLYLSGWAGVGAAFGP